MAFAYKRLVKRTHTYFPFRAFSDEVAQRRAVIEAKLKEEKVESPEVVREKAEVLAEMIQNSRYLIAFTGAGISTSTGIPDYRSAHGTILKTGPGAYEKPAEVMKTEVHVHRMKT